MQEVNDGLSSDEKVKLVSIFMNNQAAADTYISLMDEQIRRGWL